MNEVGFALLFWFLMMLGLGIIIFLLWRRGSEWYSDLPLEEEQDAPYYSIESDRDDDHRRIFRLSRMVSRLEQESVDFNLLEVVQNNLYRQLKDAVVVEGYVIEPSSIVTTVEHDPLADADVVTISVTAYPPGGTGVSIGG